MKSLILLTLVFLLSGCGGSLPPSPKPPTLDTTSSDGSDQNFKEQTTEKPKLHFEGMNRSFALNGLTYTVLRTALVKKIGNDYYHQKAEEGSGYLIITYKLKNTSKEPKTFATDPMKLVDKDEATYEPDATAAATLAMTGNHQDMILAQISPGITKTRNVVFQIPTSLKPKDVCLVVDSDDATSSDLKLVKLF